MSVLWVVPVCVLAVGSVVVAVAVRRLAAELAVGRPEVAHLQTLAAGGRDAVRAADALRDGVAALAAPARVRAARPGVLARRTGDRGR